MAHQYDSFCRLHEELLKPLDALYVEMVGRLVEQQHVGLAQEYLRQFDAHAPSTRELTRRTVKVGALESKSHQRALNLSLIVVGTHHHISVMLRREALHQFGILLALVVGALSQLPVHLVNFCSHFPYVGKCLLCLLLDGGVVLKYHHLWQISDSTPVGHSHLTFGRFLHSTQDLEHSRFSSTVFSNQCYTVALVDYETDATE